MRFHLGINYWPISSAMYWWQRFDAEEVKSDFASIRNAGFDSVRVFLLWEDFQPAPDAVSDRALSRLVTVADIAEQSGLLLLPTLFTGHMSGVNWIPEWAVQPGEGSSRFRIVSNGKAVRAKLKNWYSDESILSAQGLLAREVAFALNKQPALWAYDLGNENSNCVVPPSRESAIAWLKRITSAIRSVDSSHPITIGLHMEDLEEDRKLGPKEAATVCDFLCMHGYPFYAGWADGATDAMMLPFLGLITRWLGGSDVLFEEFGAPTVSREQMGKLPPEVTVLTERQAASFLHDALVSLHRFGFTGAMIWCYGDYAEWLWSWPPLEQAAHERYFGLWRSDRSPKPALAEIKPFQNLERREPANDLSWIDLDRADFYADPRHNLRRLYKRFREAQGFGR
jgi:endo-1,4-beta-mannosidase